MSRFMEDTLQKGEHATCSSADVYGLVASSATTPMDIVPSRTLMLTATPNIDLDETQLRKAFECYGPLKSVHVDRACISYFDLRHSAAALGPLEIGKHHILAHYCTNANARDLDEEGRVVVRVEGHLGVNDLCHIFSTYGAVRNIQEIPNVNVHRVVEFFDCRAASKAVEALNAVDGDMHAATVAYLERTRCKLFLIPPRLLTIIGLTEGHPETVDAKILPLGGAKSMTLDFAFAEKTHSQEGTHALEAATKLMLMSRTSSGILPDVSVWGYGDRIESIRPAVKAVLPSKLGLYDDEEEPSTEFTRSVGCHGSTWPSLWTGDDVDGCSLLPKSVVEQLAVPEETPCVESGLNTLVTQYIEYLESGWMLQQAVDMELVKRLQQLKCFESPAEVQCYRNGEDWKTLPRNHRKKSRFPRRSSTIDLEQETERKVQQQKMFAMDLERVKSGKDKRTTLMIKNIPNKYTQKMLLGRIELEFKGTFDFFYLPIDFKNKCNVGYGFINMTATEHIVKFVEHVHEQKWDKFNSDKVCCVTYARIQGRHALINHFQNSNLMLEDSKHQPLLFKPNGEPEPFPTKSAAL